MITLCYSCCCSVLFCLFLVALLSRVAPRFCAVWSGNKKFVSTGGVPSGGRGGGQRGDGSGSGIRKGISEPPTSVMDMHVNAPVAMNALSAPARSSVLARFAERNSEEEDRTMPEESVQEDVEGSDRERDDYVNSSMRGKLGGAGLAATFVLQDPSEADAVGLRAYSGRNQLDVAAKRAMVDLRLDAPAGQVLHLPLRNSTASFAL